MAEEPSSEPTAKNYSLREELAQNRGILRSPCGRFEQSDTGESCGVEMAVGAVCCEPLSRGIRLLLNEKFKIERRNEGRGNFFPSFPGFNRVGK